MIVLDRHIGTIFDDLPCRNPCLHLIRKTLSLLFLPFDKVLYFFLAKFP